MADVLKDAQSILQKVFGLNDFRTHQKIVIRAVLDQRDVLAILPTGGGKSICFQVPAIILPGLTLVITPLISLMENQVLALKKRHIAAAAWHSQLTSTSEAELLTQLKTNKLKLLYLSPEKLHSTKCNQWLKTQKIQLIVLDEAHCLAQWGFDFRPSYLKIAAWISSQPIKPKILALTATATPQVKTIIINQLNLVEPLIYQQSSVRTNINLVVIHRQTPISKLISIFALCQLYVTDTVLIYCATRVEVETLSKFFQIYQPDSRKILKYHGGLTADLRSQALQQFLNLPDCIMVATNAFGMGIDKPNIRLVIHSQLPSNLENYVQEIGRASRDGQPAKAVLLVSETDWQIQLELAKTQPDHHLKMLWLKHYCTTKNCLTQTLANYFLETVSACGQCCNCLVQNLIPPENIQKKYLKLTKLKLPYRQNLKLLALSSPQSLTSLKSSPGIGPKWLDKWGTKCLEILAS